VFTFEDTGNLATHLIRNALGGAKREQVSVLLSIPAPLSRRYRDDVRPPFSLSLFLPLSIWLVVLTRLSVRRRSRAPSSCSAMRRATARAAAAACIGARRALTSRPRPSCRSLALCNVRRHALALWARAPMLLLESKGLEREGLEHERATAGRQTGALSQFCRKGVCPA